MADKIPTWVTIVDLESHSKYLRLLEEANSKSLAEIAIESLEGDIYRFPEKLIELVDHDALYVKIANTGYLELIKNSDLLAAVKEQEDDLVIKILTWNEETGRNEILTDKLIITSKK